MTPAQVWVLDALPGALRNNSTGDHHVREDHPADLIPTLQAVQEPIESKAALQQHLLQAGFSQKVAMWVTGNLRPSQDDPQVLLQHALQRRSWVLTRDGLILGSNKDDKGVLSICVRTE